MAIIAGINSAPVLRLRRTWDLVKGKTSYKKFRMLENLMSSERSYSNYRAALKRPARMSRNFSSCGIAGEVDEKAIPYL
jgi:hypothetical protein